MRVGLVWPCTRNYTIDRPLLFIKNQYLRVDVSDIVKDDVTNPVRNTTR